MFASDSSATSHRAHVGGTAEACYFATQRAPRQRLRCRTSSRSQLDARRFHERRPWTRPGLRDAWYIVTAAPLELTHAIVPQRAPLSACARMRRDRWAPRPSKTRGSHGQAGSPRDAANTSTKKAGRTLPFRPGRRSGAGIVMTFPVADNFPPEAGAFPGEGRQLHPGVRRAFVELCRRLRPVQLQS